MSKFDELSQKKEEKRLYSENLQFEMKKKGKKKVKLTARNSITMNLITPASIITQGLNGVVKVT